MMFDINDINKLVLGLQFLTGHMNKNFVCVRRPHLNVRPPKWKC